MRIDKDLAKTLWRVYGRTVAGTILCIAGFIMANRGSICKGRMDIGYQMWSASPDEFDELAKKLKH